MKDYETKYEIRASVAGKDWKHMATFYSGEKSRWGAPFNDEVALLEVKSFKAHRGKEYPFVQLIITL